jgi:hypothetical protein
MVWTLIEPGVAIVASSLVTIRPLLRAWRLKGFESTGNNGPSVGPGSQLSGTNRTAGRIPGGVPGCRPGDVTLVDVEAGNGPAKINNVVRPSELANPGGYGRRQFLRTASASVSPDVSPDPGTRLGSEFKAPRPRSMVRSEVYVIEGETRTWSRDRIGSPSDTSDDIDVYEAQSQHSGRVGLGK